MSEQLKSAFESILSMGYYKNESAKSGGRDSGHEDAISKKLDSSGFTKLENRDYPKLKKSIIVDWEEKEFEFNYLSDKSDTNYKRKENQTFDKMPPGSYIIQPAGKQSFPDFLIRDFDGRFMPVEAKSGKKNDKQQQKSDNSTAAPMWNDNLPKLNAIYIYSNEKNDQTTIFLGRDVIDAEILALRKEITEAVNAVVAEFQIKVQLVDSKGRGWILTFRPQNFQGGGIEKCDYFKHVDRKLCEQNVLDYVK